MSIDKISYRLATSHDQALIDDMNVIASYGSFMPDDEMPPAATFFRDTPVAAPYSENFGREGDMGIIARDDISGEDIAAIWGREYSRSEKDGAMKDHPFEITVAVREALRGQGIGRQLLDSMATMAWLAGKSELSLGVYQSSEARRLYEAAGYIALRDADGTEARIEKFVPMVKRL